MTRTDGPVLHLQRLLARLIDAAAEGLASDRDASAALLLSANEIAQRWRQRAREQLGEEGLNQLAPVLGRDARAVAAATDPQRESLSVPGA